MQYSTVFPRIALVVAVLFGTIGVVAGPAAAAPEARFPGELASNYVETDLAKFHYVRAGSGTPVVLIAGGGLWGYSWRDVLPALAAEHTVYAVDLPSQGYTEARRPDFAYDLPAMSAAIASFLDAVGLDRATLVGHSWGGAWSMYFAQEHPDRVARLVLLDAPGLDAEKAPVTPLFTTPLLGELATELTTRSFYAENIRATFAHPRLVTDEIVDAYYLPFARPANRAGFLALWRNLDYRVTDAGLHRITAPTLVLWGGADTWLPATQAGALAARIPDATAHVLPGCGHALHEDCPALAVPLLSDFLR
ncbi:alpha/beta fold hydrolase [Nocardia sp. NPDC058379]|uniref:alpha/beta fold hydrolase n=1 Tax=unclassified Nocardia TaxID=2637762 RepID=UPI003660BB00